MKSLDAIARALSLVGAVNWGLVGLTNVDLVAKATGNDFGKTNLASRLVYGAVGAAAAYELVRRSQQRGSAG